ncbi:UDP-N-acetylmuramate dehydrogenase [soil metagenome]
MSSLDDLHDALAGVARGSVERSYPLARFTTYRLGGPAEIYVEPADLEDLIAATSELRTRDRAGEIPILVVGRGSNMVISDSGWPGIALRLGQPFAALDPKAEDPTSFDVGAGKPLPLVANWSARRALAGMEWAVGVPGSIGGAVRMNAGAHGSDMAASLVHATVLSLDTSDTSERTGEQLGLSYRHSNLTDREVVVAARLRLSSEPQESIRARMDSFRKHRAATQPGALQNAGSTFKNPEGDSAGRLVEAAGLKGWRVGGASVSAIHANFFMADETATAQDVFDLIHDVRRKVNDAFGVELTPEVRFVGPFAGREIEVHGT